MKRLALTALLSQAILWARQLRFERRLSNRQLRWEGEAARSFARFGGEVNGVLGRWRRDLERAWR